jgi:hypothetical protein
MLKHLEGIMGLIETACVLVVCEDSLVMSKILETKFKSGYWNPKKARRDSHENRVHVSSD